jgi:integrase
LQIFFPRSDELAKSGLQTRRGSRAADWVNEQSMGHILAALTAANRRVMWVALCSGLRISDVLNIKTEQLLGKKGDFEHGIKVSVRESKTGQTRRFWMPRELRLELLQHAGKLYVFPSRTCQNRHRTRQAVEKDLHRARALLRLPSTITVSCHTARKMYAVAHGRGSLHHKSKIVELMYDTADLATKKKLKGRREDLTE